LETIILYFRTQTGQLEIYNPFRITEIILFMQPACVGTLNHLKACPPDGGWRIP
jgi:hypothetical protein